MCGLFTHGTTSVQFNSGTWLFFIGILNWCSSYYIFLTFIFFFLYAVGCLYRRWRETVTGCSLGPVLKTLMLMMIYILVCDVLLYLQNSRLNKSAHVFVSDNRGPRSRLFYTCSQTWSTAKILFTETSFLLEISTSVSERRPSSIFWSYIAVYHSILYSSVFSILDYQMIGNNEKRGNYD